MSQSQKVLVAGTGLSGISAAKLLLDMGGEVVLYDSNPELDAEELKHEFDEDARITIVLGELKRTDLLGVEMCVISPGIPLECWMKPRSRSGVRSSWHISARRADWQPSPEPMARRQRQR